MKQIKPIKDEKRKVFYTTAELAEQMHVNRHKIGMMRELGMLKGVRLGKGYVYFIDTIRDFVETYGNCDLGSKNKMLIAMAIHGKKRKRRRAGTKR